MREKLNVPSRWRIRDLCVAVAIVACALGSARQPMTWVLLDARRTSNLCAGLRFGWFWVGLAVVLFLGKTPSQRFFGLAMVLIGTLLIPLAFPHVQVGHSPDLAATFSGGSFCAAVLLVVASMVAARFQGRVAAPRKRDDGYAPG